MDESNQKISTDDNDDDQDCSICLEPFTNKALVKDCLHNFCYQCIYTWSQQHPVCPLCMKPIKAIVSKLNDTYYLGIKNEKSGSSNSEGSAEEQEEEEEEGSYYGEWSDSDDGQYSPAEWEAYEDSTNSSDVDW